MEEFTVTIRSICIYIIALGIIGKFGAFTATEKVMRFVISICILVAALKSFNTASFDIDLNYPESNIFYTENVSDLKKEIIDKTQNELVKLIEDRLNEKNISYNSVSVHILEQNGSITVDKIIIDCSSNLKNAVADCIQDIVSEETEILTGE